MRTKECAGDCNSSHPDQGGCIGDCSEGDHGSCMKGSERGIHGDTGDCHATAHGKSSSKEIISKSSNMGSIHPGEDTVEAHAKTALSPDRTTKIHPNGSCSHPARKENSSCAEPDDAQEDIKGTTKSTCREAKTTDHNTCHGGDNISGSHDDSCSHDDDPSHGDSSGSCHDDKASSSHDDFSDNNKTSHDSKNNISHSDNNNESHAEWMTSWAELLCLVRLVCRGWDGDGHLCITNGNGNGHAGYL